MPFISTTDLTPIILTSEVDEVKELVVAAYDKDLSWLDRLHQDVTVTVYRKGDSCCHENEIVLENNVGRDVHTFFQHIESKYDKLSNITFFSQDYPFDHWENIVEVVNGGEQACFEKAALNIDNGYFGFHYNTINTMWSMQQSHHHAGHSIDNKNIISCDKFGNPQHINFFQSDTLDTYWFLFFDCHPPLFYEFMPGGHFAIKKSHALKRSKELYGKVVEFLSSNKKAPWIIERFECYLFNQKYPTVI